MIHLSVCAWQLFLHLKGALCMLNCCTVPHFEYPKMTGKYYHENFSDMEKIIIYTISFYAFLQFLYWPGQMKVMTTYSLRAFQCKYTWIKLIKGINHDLPKKARFAYPTLTWLPNKSILRLDNIHTMTQAVENLIYYTDIKSVFPM